ncbi:Rgg/GadR/MutR family transcriptional regulator (plasmid) [Lactococcus lactis subsp. lactis]|uniref:Rgg/GadR/MutR family transcriptional regulator n=1 Tax=Lactococcus lactis TaxID=1358 RepID=UPI0026479539|nr:Rgg/GadR/MutR family transcriptional regulator [Lactococcus lactis]WKB49928.1 Rgg/GadR/MutR family transcriptional regulator [Lactococcus lactis subsp. lactis]
MIDKRYGLIFKQLRVQKGLPLSYFEKFGVLKSNLGRFERGETMMGFERLVTLLQALNISLADYEAFFNYYLPEYQEHFLFELEKADFSLNKTKLLKLYNEISQSEHRMLILLTKSKLSKLHAAEVTEIRNYLNKVKHWGYFELCLNYAMVEEGEVEDILKIVEQFEVKTSYNCNYDLQRYRRKIHQIAYLSILRLCSKKNRLLAEEVLELTTRPEDEKLDFYISTFRILAVGYLNFCFNDEKSGLSEIEHALDLFEELGNKRLRIYYQNVINSFIIRHQKGD